MLKIKNKIIKVKRKTLDDETFKGKVKLHVSENEEIVES